MRNIERTSQLLFELSGNERIRILLKIRAERQKLSQLSKDLNLTASEAFRHLQRLTKMELIEKDGDGLFGLTAFGQAALSLLPGFDFLARNRSFLLERDISVLPLEFTERIGELQDGELGSDTMYNLRWVELMIQEAQEYIWIMTDQILVSSIPLIEERTGKDVRFRCILPQKIVPPPGFRPMNAKSVTANKTEEKYVEKVRMIIALSEKTASFCLPDRQGKIDYRGFASRDKEFHGWVRDLFLYHWQKASPTTP